MKKLGVYLAIGMIIFYVVPWMFQWATKGKKIGPESERVIGQADDFARKVLKVPVERGYKPGKTGEGMKETLTLKLNVPETVHYVSDWNNVMYSCRPDAPLKVIYNKGMSRLKPLPNGGFKKETLEHTVWYDPEKKSWMTSKDGADTLAKAEDLPAVTTLTLVSTEVDNLPVTLTGTHQ